MTPARPLFQSVKTDYILPPADKAVILRYAGIAKPTPQDLALLDECLAKCEGVFAPATAEAEFPLSRSGDTWHLGFAEVESRLLSIWLDGADCLLVFAATVGAGIDRLIRQYADISPAKALMLQAIGTERVEALCDLVCLNVSKRHPDRDVGGRFSPGYGDFGLSAQKAIFDALAGTKNIGVTLSDSLLMFPTKSVTALMGLKVKK